MVTMGQVVARPDGELLMMNAIDRGVGAGAMIEMIGVTKSGVATVKKSVRVTIVRKRRGALGVEMWTSATMIAVPANLTTETVGETTGGHVNWTTAIVVAIPNAMHLAERHLGEEMIQTHGIRGIGTTVEIDVIAKSVIAVTIVMDAEMNETERKFALAARVMTPAMIAKMWTMRQGKRLID